MLTRIPPSAAGFHAASATLHQNVERILDGSKLDPKIAHREQPEPKRYSWIDMLMSGLGKPEQ